MFFHGILLAWKVSLLQMLKCREKKGSLSSSLICSLPLFPEGCELEKEFSNREEQNLSETSKENEELQPEGCSC